MYCIIQLDDIWRTVWNKLVTIDLLYDTSRWQFMYCMIHDCSYYFLYGIAVYQQFLIVIVVKISVWAPVSSGVARRMLTLSPKHQANFTQACTVNLTATPYKSSSTAIRLC